MLIEAAYLNVLNEVKEKSENGDALSMSLLGNIYYDGIGTVKNEEKGIDCYRESVVLAQQTLDPLSHVWEEMQYYHLAGLLGFHEYYFGCMERAKEYLLDAFDYAFAAYPKEVAKTKVLKDSTYSHLVLLGCQPEI